LAERPQCACESCEKQEVKLCVFGKQPEDFVFTRSNGQAVRDFRGAWAKACEKAEVPGLLFHDLRRTAAWNLRKAGVADGVIMKIRGWRTRSVFERYAIDSQSDIADAIGRLEVRDGHSLGHSEAKKEEPATNSPN
jgi:integrase